MLAYKEAKDGQILHLGINEAGSLAAFTAAGHVATPRTASR
jgi:pyruvate dehydrogenase E1 component